MRKVSEYLVFVDIEGKVSPKDCFLSRWLVIYAICIRGCRRGEGYFFGKFIERIRRLLFISNTFYVIIRKRKLRPGVVRFIFQSIVLLSDNDDLMGKYLILEHSH